MGQSIEDYGKFQGSTTPGRFREAGATAVTGLCMKAAELRTRIKAIPGQAARQSSHQDQEQAYARKSNLQEEQQHQQLSQQKSHTHQHQVSFPSPEAALQGSLPCSGSALTVGAESGACQAQHGGPWRREGPEAGGQVRGRGEEVGIERPNQYPGKSFFNQDPSWGRHQAFLPRATLPSFSGRVTELAEFWRRFAAMTAGPLHQYT